MHTKKSQTATEYLIILAVVIVIALIVVGILGGIPSIGGGTGESAARAALSSAPVGISAYSLSPVKGQFALVNNLPSTIRVDTIAIGTTPCWLIGTNQNPSLTPSLRSGERRQVSCGSVSVPSNSRFDLPLSITYTDLQTNAQYTLTDLALVGRAASFECPDGFIPVPGGFVLADGSTVDDFCVMKYEAKCASDATGQSCPSTDLPISQAANRPWVNIDWYESVANCTALGEGYSLISDQQWMVLAENILNTNINDLNASQSDPQLSNGRSSMAWGDGSAAAGVDPDLSECYPEYSLDASENDNCGLRGSEGYIHTNGNWNMVYSASSAGRGDLRIHMLSNGEVIWDLAGNVLQWSGDVIATTPSSAGWYNSVTDYSGIEWMKPSQLGDGGNNGFGYRVTYGSSNRVAVRGGFWSYGAYAGVFTVDDNIVPSDAPALFGFRCVYSPGG